MTMNGFSRTHTLSWRFLLIAVAAVALVFGSTGVLPTAHAVTGAAIQGSVLGINDDPTGANAWDDPLPGVRVAVFDAATNAFLTGIDTNALGQYRISGLPAKAVKVRFTKSGWLTKWHAPVTPATGSITNLGEDVVYAEAVIMGKVYSWFDPIEGARVTAFDAATGALVAAVNAPGDESKFRIGGLAAGTYQLRATKTGYITDWSGPITVVAGQTYDPPLFWLDIAPAVELQGSVVGGGGPLSGVRVLVTNAATGASIAAVNTDAAGKYRIPQLPPQQAVRVRFTKTGWLTAYYPQNLYLEAYLTPRNLGQTTMTKEAAISGQVLSWMDPIVSDARVTVYDANTRAVIAAIQADGDGHFRLGGLPAGPVKVRATAPGRITAWANGTTTAPTFETAAVYNLVAGQELKLGWFALDVWPEAVVVGTVVGVDSAGAKAPLAGVRVLLVDATTGKAVAAVDTDAQGKYRIAQLVHRTVVNVRFTTAGYLTASYPGTVTLDVLTSPMNLGQTTMRAVS